MIYDLLVIGKQIRLSLFAIPIIECMTFNSQGFGPTKDIG
jgi:hypothetical protein